MKLNKEQLAAELEALGDVVVVSRVGGIGWRVLQLYVFPRSLFQLREIFAYLANMRGSNKVDK